MAVLTTNITEHPVTDRVGFQPLTYNTVIIINMTSISYIVSSPQSESFICRRSISNHLVWKHRLAEIAAMCTFRLTSLDVQFEAYRFVLKMCILIRLIQNTPTPFLKCCGTVTNILWEGLKKYQLICRRVTNYFDQWRIHIWVSGCIEPWVWFLWVFLSLWHTRMTTIKKFDYTWKISYMSIC